MTITHLAVDHHRIPLPVVLSDSTHGDITEFELVTVRLRDAAGADGVGYTYTVGRGGAALASSAPNRTSSRRCGNACGGRCITAAAAAMRASRSRLSTSRCGI